MRNSLHIGMGGVDPAAYGGWTGLSRGSPRDVERMQRLAQKSGFGEVVLLRDSQATCASVPAYMLALTRGFQPDDLLFVSYSGHGTQLPESTGGNESDGKDEAWCLWDGYLRDNSLWLALCALPPCRVFVVTDCCFAYGTLREPEILLPATLGRRVPPLGVLHSKVVHFAGCREQEAALESPKGSEWSSMLDNAWRAGGWGRWAWLLGRKDLSYEEWFHMAKRRTSRRQWPSLEAFGPGLSFLKREALR